MNQLLRLDGVHKNYGRSAVLKGVSLDLHPGEFVVLIGGSGSGKTTLLRLVAGLARADAGTIELRGSVIDRPGTGQYVPSEKRHLGMVFQDYALWPHFSCLANVEAGTRGTNGSRRKRAMELLDWVGMADFANKRPHELSGGQQQRVGVARALAVEPDLLLFDEALSSLDTDIRDQLRLQIRKLAHETGSAALFVSHDPLDAWRLADRVAVLEDGILTQVDTPAQLYARPATARVARFIGAAGGFAANIEQAGNQSGIRLEDTFIPVRCNHLSPGQESLVYVRPQGIRPGTDGVRAQLQFCAFENGRYRAYWQIAGCSENLCSEESTCPPARTRLTIDPEHILVYPAKSRTEGYAK